MDIALTFVLRKCARFSMFPEVAITVGLNQIKRVLLIPCYCAKLNQNMKKAKNKISIA